MRGVVKLGLILVLVFNILILNSFDSYASRITIQSKVTVSDVTYVEIANYGDETAFNLQLNMTLNGKSYSSQIIPSLKVQQKYNWTIKMDKNFDMPGKYFAVLKVVYHDMNAYPFSVITLTPINHNSNKVSDIIGKITPLSLYGTQYLEYELFNTGDSVKQVNLNIVAPNEINIIDDSSFTVSINPKETKKMRLKISKGKALKGSTYSVHILTSYVEGGILYSSSISNQVRIVDKMTILNSNKTLIFIISVLTIILIIIQLGWTKKWNIEDII